MRKNRAWAVTVGTGPTVRVQLVRLRRVRPLARAWTRGRAAYSKHQPHQLHWWIRLGGWVALATPLALFTNPWLTPLGPILFETAVFTGVALARRRSRPQPAPGPSGGGNETPDDPDAGVREPRHPFPLVGAGAVALPLPDTQLDDEAVPPALPSPS